MPRSLEDPKLNEMGRYLRMLMRRVEGPEAELPLPRPRADDEVGLRH
jgi:hypothetical protein